MGRRLNVIYSKIYNGMLTITKHYSKLDQRSDTFWQNVGALRRALCLPLMRGGESVEPVRVETPWWARCAGRREGWAVADI